MNENILKSVKEVRENSKKRNFPQSFDLIVNLKLFDPKKPESKINEIIILPKDRGKESEVVVFSDTLKDAGSKVYGSDNIESLAKDKRDFKKLAASTDFFLAEPKLMVSIGKNLGSVLAPKGKMPTPLVGDLKQMIGNYKKSVRLKAKDSPVIQSSVGSDSMKDEDVAENIEFVLNFLEKKLPKGKNNIGTVRLKLTMGKPVKLAV